MKKNIYKIIALFSFFYLNIFSSLASNNAQKIHCAWLPGCKLNNEQMTDKISGFFALMMQYVGVIAVISLIASGFMYITSWGEEEKLKKAKKWVIWSLVWVFLSITAWSIVNLINNFKI